jgi:hypothetical protein
MEHVVNLDAAAAEIERRRSGWAGGGLTISAVTWLDQAADWPQTLETDRRRVQDPRSIGVRIMGEEGAEAQIVLFRGAWADVDYASGYTGWEAVTEAPEIRSATEFGAVLDAVVARAFGVQATASAMDRQAPPDVPTGR